MKPMKSTIVSVLNNLGIYKEEKPETDVKNISTAKNRTPVEIFNEEFKKEPTIHELSFQG